MFADTCDYLRRLNLENSCCWLAGFSDGQNSALLALLVFEVVASIRSEDRHEQIPVLCADTHRDVPAKVETIATTLYPTQRSSGHIVLRIDTHLFKPLIKISLASTQSLETNRVSVFVEHHLIRWDEAILHFGARKWVTKSCTICTKTKLAISTLDCNNSLD